MGLDTTHGAFQGAYSSFMRFRKQLIEHYNKTDIDNLDGYGGHIPCSSIQDLGVRRLMNQSDCDGEISPDDCKMIADSLDKLIPSMDSASELKSRSVQFRDGCLLAYSKGEIMEFK